MMAFWDDDEEEKKPIPTGIWGSPDFGKDQYFGDRNRHFRGSPLGMGKRVLSSMAPQVRSSVVPTVRVGEPTSRSMMHPSMTPVPKKSMAPPVRSPVMMGETSRSMRSLPAGNRMNQFFEERAMNPAPALRQSKETLAEMMRKKREQRTRDKESMAEYLNVGANLGMGFVNAKTNKEREAVAQQAAMYGATKALEFGANKMFDYFNPEDAEAGVKAVAADHTAGLLKQASQTVGDPAVMDGAQEMASSALDTMGDASGDVPIVGAAIHAGQSLASGQGPIETVADVGAQALGGYGGAALGAMMGPAAPIAAPVLAMLGSKAAGKGMDEFQDITGLGGKKMKPAMRPSAIQDPAQYGGVSRYLFV